jgi:hypothetical protein
MMGVKKLRERNRQELAVISQEAVPKGDRDYYYRRLHHHLHNFVAEIENPVPFSETLSTEIEDPSNSRHETTFDTAVTKGIAGIFSTLAHDFPEIHHLRKSTINAATLTKEKKAAMNLSKLCIKSKHLLHQQSSTKTAIKKEEVDELISFSMNTQQHDDAYVNMHTLELGLRGIVVQYLQDAVKDFQRNKMLEKYNLALEDGDIGTVQSSNQLVIKLLSESNEDSPTMDTSHVTPPTITETESFSGNHRSMDLVSCKSLHDSVSSGRSCSDWSRSSENVCDI